MAAKLPPDPTDHPPWHARLIIAMTPWRGAGVVVAVSGGGDSVALLRGLLAVSPELDLRLSVACFDHATRAGESARDAAFVAELAARLRIPCDLGHWQGPRRAAHFEADARRARYAWLLEVAQNRQAAAVAVGHTNDDQAETILHRIVRGTGLHGLAGMPAQRPLGPGVTLIRPILGTTRRELRDHLTATGQDWRDDPTNLDQTRTRSRIRHDLLPRLAADYNPHVADALIRLGGLAALASRRADRMARRRLDRMVVDRSDSWITFHRKPLQATPPAERADVLRLAWRQLAWPEGRMTRARWDRLTTLAGGLTTGTTPIQADISVEATPDHFTLHRKLDVAPPASPPQPRPLAIPGSTPWLGGRITASLTPFNPADPRDEWIDRATIQGPLLVRPPRPGDRFDPLGLDGHSQSLADFCRGRAVPRADRPQIPLVADAHGIIWVVGHRISHRVRRTEATVAMVGFRHESKSESA